MPIMSVKFDVDNPHERLENNSNNTNNSTLIEEEVKDGHYYREDEFNMYWFNFMREKIDEDEDAQIVKVDI